MPTRDEILEYLRSIKSRLSDELGIHTIGLFGSYAQNRQHTSSDIDLLIEFHPDTPELFEKKEKLRELISTRFHKNVDICRKKYLKPYYAKGVLDSVVYA